MLPTSLRLRSLRRAETVLTVSRHTWGECRRYLGIAASRLHVVYESIPSAFSEPCGDGAVQATCERLGLHPGDLVVLHVGSNDPRKNVATVCRVSPTTRPERPAREAAQGGRPARRHRA